MACRQNGVVFAGLVLSVFRGSVNRKSGTVSVSKAVPAALPFAAVARVHIVKLSPVQGPYYKASSLTGIAVLDPLSSILGELKVSALLDSCTSLQVELEKGAHAALVSMQKDPRKIPRIAMDGVAKSISSPKSFLRAADFARPTAPQEILCFMQKLPNQYQDAGIPLVNDSGYLTLGGVV